MSIHCEAADCQNTMPSQRKSWRIWTAGRVSFACSADCASALIGANVVVTIWDPEVDDDGECPRCHCDAWTPGRISADCECACHQMPVDWRDALETRDLEEARHRMRWDPVRGYVFDREVTQ